MVQRHFCQLHSYSDGVGAVAIVILGQAYGMAEGLAP